MNLAAILHAAGLALTDVVRAGIIMRDSHGGEWCRQFKRPTSSPMSGRVLDKSDDPHHARCGGDCDAATITV